MSTLPVMPIGPVQMTDIRDEHKCGCFRICASYKSPAKVRGFDRFPFFAAELFGRDPDYWNYHLIVQLKGCPFRCIYCYVDDAGIRGHDEVNLEIGDLVRGAKQIMDRDDRLHVFHLMGGAPALHIQKWAEVARTMSAGGMSDVIFHSDIVLVEPSIIPDFVPSLQKLATYPNHLIAICIKGVTEANFRENVRTDAFSLAECLENLHDIVRTGIKYYITLINPDTSALPSFLNHLTDLLGWENAQRIQLLRVRPYNVTRQRLLELDASDSVLALMDHRFAAAEQIVDRFTRHRHISSCPTSCGDWGRWKTSDQKENRHAAQIDSAETARCNEYWR